MVKYVFPHQKAKTDWFDVDICNNSWKVAVGVSLSYKHNPERVMRSTNKIFFLL